MSQADIQQLSPKSTLGNDGRGKAKDDERAKFVSVVLGYTEDVWDSLFAVNGRQYVKPRLALFRNTVESACGMASAASGPFYCPSDQEVYIDLSFYEELENRFQAPEILPKLYNVAHEVGTSRAKNFLAFRIKWIRLRQQLSQGEYNKYSVMLELQADFLPAFGQIMHSR